MVLFDVVTLIGTTSLIIQVVVLLLLIVGYRYKRKLKFKQHGTITAAAVGLHLVMIFAVMIPAFIILLPGAVNTPLNSISLITLIHGITGIVAIAFGAYLVAVWGFRSNLKSCFLRKKLMRYTLAVWVTSLIFGIVMYGVFYAPLLLG